MAITEPTSGGRIIEEGIGDVKVVVSEAVAPGDLLGSSEANGGNWIKADGNNNVYAELVAGEAGAVASTITAYRIARVSGYTGATQAAALYLSDTVGRVSESAGTVGQLVGFILSATEVLLCPQWRMGGGIINGAVKQFFRDSNGWINSPSAGKLESSRIISPTTEKKATATTATLAIADCGTIQDVATDSQVLTLPATAAGLHFTIRNAGEDGAVLVTISPNSADKISGAGLTPQDNKDLLNTKATAKKGDYVKLLGDGVDGWVVTEMVGTWAREA